MKSLLPVICLLLCSSLLFSADNKAENILLHQRDTGGWPKNYDRDKEPNRVAKKVLLALKKRNDSTFDNGATHTEVRYLAKAFLTTGDKRYREACLNGIQFMLEAQYANGGWPPNSPLFVSYAGPEAAAQRGENSLRARLAQFGVDTATWGTGDAKDVADLQHEHAQSESTLEVEEGRLLRPGTDRRILADFRVAEILDSDAPMVPEGSTLEDLAALLPETRRNHFAVLDPDGRLLGMLDITTLRGIILDPDLRRLTPVETAMDSDIPMVGEWDSLQSALNLFEESGSWVLPVVKEDGSFLGTVSKSTIFDRYRRELIVQTAPRAE